MVKIYLDNAATTKMDDFVIDEMSKAMRTNYGNPSSVHQVGRTAKSLVETCRKKIASSLNVSSSEIIFTSGGTEADNLILNNAVENLGVTTIITTKIEHHAVLHTIKKLQEEKGITIIYLSVNQYGEIDLSELENHLKQISPNKCLVSLMQINNEIGNLYPIDDIATLCKQYQSLFHSDTVQVIGHYSLNLKETPIDFITASAHKFHGPKGIGFAFFRKGIGIKPMIFGGNQEKGARSGTENTYNILGMTKALEIAMQRMETDTKYITELKMYFIQQLTKFFPNLAFNGLSNDLKKSSYTILNVRFLKENPMALFNLDLAGIAVSGGSACQSGSSKGSHVLNEILSLENTKKTSIRFSFSKYNTQNEIDYTIEQLKKIFLD